jgi:uncharacterized protein YbjT (DUF2867 family)
MNILLTGASGFIGTHLLRTLHARGYRVKACVRSPQQAEQDFPGPGYIGCDFSVDTDPAIWRQRLEGIDVIINAVGIIREDGGQRFDRLHRDTPVALFQAAADTGVKRVIQISALGASATAQSHYHRSKHAADAYLAELPLEWTILRPSIVYGPGAKSMALFRALAALPVTPLVADGQQPLQPIHIDDLTRAVLQCVESQKASRAKIDLVGPAPLTLRELLVLQRQWLGLGRLRTLSLPYPLALRLSALAGFFRELPVNKETIQMLQQGNQSDVTPFTKYFDFTPRAMDAVLSTTPAIQADRWQAGLYFLRPLLRISLALLWIFTGITSAFLYPAEISYTLLHKIGISGVTAPIVLYGAAALDGLLGMALLLRIRLREAAWIQIALMLGYSTIISVTLPEFWLHPFGPVSKNLPLLIATLIMLVLERR